MKWTIIPLRSSSVETGLALPPPHASPNIHVSAHSSLSFGRTFVYKELRVAATREQAIQNLEKVKHRGRAHVRILPCEKSTSPGATSLPGWLTIRSQSWRPYQENPDTVWMTNWMTTSQKQYSSVFLASPDGSFHDYKFVWVPGQNTPVIPVSKR